MRVTICAHAALYIETSDQRILLDPFFDDTLVAGALTYHPGRIFEVDKMPLPTVIVVTHGHFDHFHLESLQKLPRHLPLITSHDPPVIEQLIEAGFSNVIVCMPWQEISIGNTQFIATPSEHEEEEIGLLIRNEGCSFWHIADSEVVVDTGKKLVERYGSIDLISAKYQPSVDAMIGYARNMGAAFEKSEFVDWLEAACECEPKLIFPYASGICFQGRHEWLNRYAFPISETEVVRLLQKRLGSPERATSVLPGDSIDWRAGEQPKKHSQTSPFVRTKASPPIEWEPVDISTLSGVASGEERQILREKLEAFLADPLRGWLQRKFSQGNNGWTLFRDEEIVWQLVVHLGDGERLNYYIDFRSPELAASEGKHPEGNFFTHISGQTLYEVLQGEAPGIIFWLTGSARSYEKIVGVRGGKFYFPSLPVSPKHHLCDPLTYYLRHFGRGELAPNEPDMMIAPETRAAATSLDRDVAVLIRRGGNDQVVGKKALLTYLCLKEAENLGLEVTEEEVQGISDAFRRLFDLLDSGATERWIEESGLTIESYSRMMQNLATVIKVEKQYAGQLTPLRQEHERIVQAQSIFLGV